MQRSGSKKGSANFASSVKRGSKSKLVVNTPGPGQYPIPTSFKVKKKPENLQFFGSTTHRFAKQRSRREPGEQALLWVCYQPWQRQHFAASTDSLMLLIGKRAAEI
jgi:hypothetical protein